MQDGSWARSSVETETLMMSEREVSSRLFYHGTNEEVRLGDRIRIRRFLFLVVEGVVCYIPGASPKHPDMEYDDYQFWAIQLKDGQIRQILYSPDELQPGRETRLLSRGESFVPLSSRSCFDSTCSDDHE